MIDLVKMATTSHLTKLFDGTPVAEGKIDVLRAILRSAPSSFNIQGTHYAVASSIAARTRIAKSVQNGFEFNEPKILTASHVIVFCSRINLSFSHMEDVAEREHRDGKFPSDELEERWREIVRSGLAAHEYDLKDMPHWIEKQTYLALGVALMAAAELDISALAMEGFDHETLDAELGLRDRGYTSSVLLALGNQSPKDYSIGAPKSRLPEDRYFTDLD